MSKKTTGQQQKNEKTAGVCRYYAGGVWLNSHSEKRVNISDPSTGRVIAQTPHCTEEEIENAIAAAKAAYPAWRDKPAAERARVLFRLRDLLDQNLEPLAKLSALESGKAWADAVADIEKAKEATEIACSIPQLLMGESLMETFPGIDTVLYRESVGVFSGIVPFNFPAMIPMGWITPLCIACGNTIVLKAASLTPQTSMAIARLYASAGLPPGVLNIVTCAKEEADLLLSHPDIGGISFVGSTRVGRSVYTRGCAAGKRVQALCEAKNHALVLRDAPVEATAQAIVEAAFGSNGQRCMALPVVVAEEGIADRLAAAIVERAQNIKVGPAYDKKTEMGPVISQKHKDFVEGRIATGVEEGARLLLDGRGCQVPGYEGGFYIGPTVFDHVGPEMRVGNFEIFGPVLCVKRVRDFDEGLDLMNRNPFAKGASIFTAKGHYAREFQRRSDAGMVGVNMGIPAPLGIFPFSGHKESFFGDLHCLGKDGIRFFTDVKSVTTHWFPEEK